jgi:hypothetical protein
LVCSSPRDKQKLASSVRPPGLPAWLGNSYKNPLLLPLLIFFSWCNVREQWSHRRVWDCKLRSVATATTFKNKTIRQQSWTHVTSEASNCRRRFPLSAFRPSSSSICNQFIWFMNTKHETRQDENKTCTHFGNWPSPPPPLPSVAALLHSYLLLLPLPRAQSVAAWARTVWRQQLHKTRLLPQQQQRYKMMAGIL